MTWPNNARSTGSIEDSYRGHSSGSGGRREEAPVHRDAVPARYRFIAPVTEGALASPAARENSATAVAPAGPPPLRTTNLPEAVSELTGREANLGHITALVTEHRLVIFCRDFPTAYSSPSWALVEP
jgi:hypothetical protein